MHIYISPYAIAFIAIIILIICLGFGKSKPFKICYIIISSILATLGMIGMIFARPILVSTLEKNLDSGRLEIDRIEWVINNYDSFASVSIKFTAFICLLIIVLLYLSRSNKKSKLWNSVTAVVYMIRFFLIVTALVYSYDLINYEFDVASYILTMAIAETLVLYIPIVVRRIALLKV